MHFAPLLRALSTFFAIATIYMYIKDCPRACWVAMAFLLALLLLCRKRILTAFLGTTSQNSIGSSSKLILDDPEGCKGILGCNLGSLGLKTSLSSKLQARALPNKRLQIAFGIDNAFTTTDVDWYRQFRRLSESYLRVSSEQWRSLAKTARQIALQGIPCTSFSLALAPLIQLLTLKISFQLFFGLDASTLDDKKVSYIASEINRIWVSSKQSGRIEGWQQQDGLIQALRAVVPGCDPLRPKDNPMNLILPSYETMWRVVFRCLIEVHFRNHPSAPRWQSVLHVFLHTPTPEVFNEVVDDEVSAAAIAKEALRLYPPTRRIYRDLPSGEQHLSLPSSPAPPTSTPQECVRVAANVEALHRDSAQWRGCGVSHASNFWPQRWICASRAGVGRGDGPFLAFGGSLFACPACSEFGPMMVALLVATLSDALPGEVEVEGKYAGEMTAGLPLSSDREAYSDLQIVRK